MAARFQDVIRDLRDIAIDSDLDLDPEERDSVVRFLELLGRTERWGHVNVNPDQQELLFEAIIDGPRPFQTLKVWGTALRFIRHGTNELMAGRALLSEETGISPQEVTRSLSRLVEIGAFSRIQHGRYRLNPHLVWQGPLVKRAAAARAASPLRAAARGAPPT